MKVNIVLPLSILLALVLSGCSGGSGDSNSTLDSSENQSPVEINSSSNSPAVTYSTNNILCALSELTFNNDESVNANSSYSWSCNTQNRMLTGNGIPNHEVGTFPNTNNPNTISVQTINENFVIF